MSLFRQKRQHTRVSTRLALHVTVDDAAADQVAPVRGHRVDAVLENVSAGGARLRLPTYLPRSTALLVEVPALGTAPPQRVTAQVVAVEMVNRDPSYVLGIRFAQQQDELVARLEQAGAPADDVDDASPPTPPALDAAASELPRWLAVAQAEGLVTPAAAVEACRACNHDERRIADWLTNKGHVSQRDLTLVQAETWNLPFVEPGDYRIRVENNKVVREELARANGLFPLFVFERYITLAVNHPLDLSVLDQIRLQTGCEVDCCLTSPREVQHLIEWGYGGFHQTPDTAVAGTGEVVWDDLLKDVADAPAVKLVDVLLERAVTGRASDVHIDAEEETLRVRLRIDGVLREVPAPPRSLLPALVARIKVLAHLDIAETRRPQDGHFKLVVENEELDIRVSTLPSTNGEAVVLRLLRSGARLLTLEELGMQADTLATFDQLIHLPHGMLLVTGPTGSGKTTTLYSGITRLDRTSQSIITLEDPVEIRLPQVRQVAVNPKAGLTFGSGLRSILRQDPDVVMVGEVRDRETAEIALQAALTGHIVLSTLHTNSAAAAPNRLLDMGVADFLVASALSGVMAQRLCRKLCGHCAQPAEELPAGLASLAQSLVGDRPTMTAAGCKRCGHTGYEGRVGIYELIVINDDIRRAVLNHTDDRMIAELARQSGTRSLLEDGAQKVLAGETSLAELLRVAGQADVIAAGASQATSTTSPPHNEAEAAFDVDAYEASLRAWLQADPAPAGTPVAGGE